LILKLVKILFIFLGTHSYYVISEIHSDPIIQLGANLVLSNIGGRQLSFEPFALILRGLAPDINQL
jgi:hypothetical protein